MSRRRVSCSRSGVVGAALSVTWDTIRVTVGWRSRAPVNNRSPYRVGNFVSWWTAWTKHGRIVGQRVRWAIGELGGGSRLYFDVPVTPAAHYRVSVFSYDRVDEASIMLP